jgi:glycolate oxidase iron-sulfur subunit
MTVEPANRPPTGEGSGASESVPSRRGLLDLTGDCVHCGFCLPACPTYALDSNENDSPRGRIHLARQVVTGQATLDAGVAEHFDACLGCLACVPACPSGVRYDQIIEEVRPLVEAASETRTLRQRIIRALIFSLFPHPGRLRVAALFGAFYHRSGLRSLVGRTRLLRGLPLIAAMERLLPAVAARDVLARRPESAEAVGERRRDVAVLTGCVQRVFFGDVNDATVRVLAAEGCGVRAPRAQGCCGALSLHAGRVDEARRYARALIDAFGDAASCDAIVVNVAGCGSTLKEYGALLADDPAYAERAASFAARVKDVTEVLAELEPRAPRHPVPARLAYHDACHLSHGQGVREQPRRVLAAIPGLEVVEPADSGFCCGSAGVYNLVQPENAERLGRAKAQRLRETGAQAIATGNPGCLLQIGRYLDEGEKLPIVHPIQLVDASIRGVKPW